MRQATYINRRLIDYVEQMTSEWCMNIEATKPYIHNVVHAWQVLAAQSSPADGNHCNISDLRNAFVVAALNISLTTLSSPGQYVYNEVILDTWRGGGWGRGEDLRPLVSAIFIDAGATAPAKELARSVQRVASSDGVPLPLLSYDRMRPQPFDIMDDSPSPPSPLPRPRQRQHPNATVPAVQRLGSA